MYLVAFGLAATAFLKMADTAIFEAIAIGIIGGISVFLRQLSDIFGRPIYSFIATLGVMLPITLLTPKITDRSDFWALLLWSSVVGITTSLLHGIIGRYISPNE